VGRTGNLPAHLPHWADCYTNNAPFMVRNIYDYAREGELLRLLEVQLVKRLRGTRTPYVYVRLHQSGDFPPRGTHGGGEMLGKYPRLMVFGYSHWPRRAISALS